MLMCARFLTLLLLILFPQVGVAQGETRAVLVGISDYLYLEADLEGPRNDVRLLAETLILRGVKPENITVLTGEASGFAEGITVIDPLRANILGALDDLAAQSQKGDTSIFYYSGHGSRMPDKNGDELGGYDEIFLPSDAKKWRGDIGAVENAIVDDELGEKAAAILATGGKLVGILDACFSGTGFRAIATQGRARFLDPSELGVPEPKSPSSEPESRAELSGEFAFLYSSQPEQRSFEYPSEGVNGEQVWYGEFTRNLVRVLRREPNLTYGQLLQATKKSMRKATATQTPDGEGGLLDAPVFGSTAVQDLRVAIKDGVFQGGLFSNLTEGAEITIYSEPVGGASIGIAVATKIKAGTAKLVAEDGFTIPPQVYGVVTRPGLPAPLVFGFPRPVHGNGGYDYIPLDMAIRALYTRAGITSFRFAEQGYDLALVYNQGTVALLGRDGVLDPSGADSSPRLAIDPTLDLAPQVNGWLERIARVYALRQAVALAEQDGTGGFSLKGSGLKVTLERRKGGQVGSICTEAASDGQVFEDGGAVDHCDQLWLSLQNNSRKAQDVTVLYVDRDFNISALFPRNNLSNRLGSGERKRLGFQIVNPPMDDGLKRRAFEELIVLSVTANPDGPRTVLTGLAEQGKSRAVSGSGLADYLNAATDPDTKSRAFNLKKPISPLKVSRFGIEILPQQ